MRIWGVDFTSAPRRAKPIMVAKAWLAGDVLTVGSVDPLPEFATFEAFLTQPGPWVAGFDLPFTQSRRFLEGVGWPLDWGGCADLVSGLTRSEFREVLEKYKEHRPSGDREHPRLFEKSMGATSPQKLYGVPVALMYYEALPRLRRAGLHLPGLCDGDRNRIAVEAYPGVCARALIGRTSYKSDGRDTPARLTARQRLIAALTGAAGKARFGLTLHLPPGLGLAGTGDDLDAVICALQAAWAHRMGLTDAGLPGLPEPVEGWIADPFLWSRA